jgi:hypothetical protein
MRKLKFVSVAKVGQAIPVAHSNAAFLQNPNWNKM